MSLAAIRLRRTKYLHRNLDVNREISRTRLNNSNLFIEISSSEFNKINLNIITLRVGISITQTAIIENQIATSRHYYC